MKKGFTTGTAAAAAAKAHWLFMSRGEVPQSTDIILPDGDIISVEVVSCSAEMACVVKDAGDDPDVTHGALICANVQPGSAGEVLFKGGGGVGIVTKMGLQLPVGEPAINPVPRQMIVDNLNSAGFKGGVVTVSVPDGERLAEDTFNSRIGIFGGISIIGTTGIVEPMSIKALKATIRCEIDVLAENGCTYLVLVPGKIGEKHIRRFFPETPSVIMSNFAGFALGYCREKGIECVRLAGHPGKLAKIAMGYYDTHSKNSPMAQGFISEKLRLGREFNTVEELCASVDSDGLNSIAELISARVYKDCGVRADVTLFDMSGELKGSYDA